MYVYSYVYPLEKHRSNSTYDILRMHLRKDVRMYVRKYIRNYMDETCFANKLRKRTQANNQNLAQKNKIEMRETKTHKPT